jgi:mRNA interferase RelE/StbE
MPKYTAVLSKLAERQLNKLSDHIAEPIIVAITNLEENPRPIGSKKLKGRDVVEFE